MKWKSLLILAGAALVLAACSQDDRSGSQASLRGQARESGLLNIFSQETTLQVTDTLGQPIAGAQVLLGMS